MTSQVRLNKFISETGVCSRRQADKWIEAGRVTCNGQRAVLGTQVADGRRGAHRRRTRSARRSRRSISRSTSRSASPARTKPTSKTISSLSSGIRERIFAIGRLDKDSEGLILLTNNGDIVNEILRSENNHEKEYIVTVDRPITDFSLAMMASGVHIMGEHDQSGAGVEGRPPIFRIILTQGLNRQIRRMCSALGYKRSGCSACAS